VRICARVSSDIRHLSLSPTSVSLSPLSLSPTSLSPSLPPLSPSLPHAPFRAGASRARARSLSRVCVWGQLVEDRMSYIEGADQNQ